jgi:hypothetical protein
VAGEPHPAASGGAGSGTRLALVERSPGFPRGHPTAGSEISAPHGNAPVPEAWIGRPVELVFVSGSSTEYTDGILQEVNDRGIVLSVETHVGHPAQPLFYPWGAIIQLSEEQNG